MGNDKLKVLVGGILSVTELVFSVADGFSFGLIGKLVDVAKKAGPALAAAPQAALQYMQMSDDEALDVENYVVAEFDIENDKVEAVIEQALKVAVELRSLVALFVKKPAA